jgi:hypothetical protein
MKESHKTKNNTEEENEIRLRTTVQETTDVFRKGRPSTDDFDQFYTIEDTCMKIVSEVKPQRKITEYIN